MRAKTAASVIRYRGEHVIALLDSTQVGRTAQELLGIGGPIPVIGSLDAAADANLLLVGIAPAGGKIPAAWRPIILDAIQRGMSVSSGLHEFLCDDPEFSQAAVQHHVELLDARKNDEHDVADATGFRAGCVRIETVGQDCSVGKMVTAIELARGLTAAGHDAQFVATGQTGIMIEGVGCPVDCVVADFINGAVEKLVRANEHHDFVVIEGQGSLSHPRYSPVTLGLMHGARPQGLVLCYEAARPHTHGMEHVPLTPLAQLRQAYELSASLVHPAKVIGIGVNSRRLSAEDARTECARVENELDLPACDVFRDGPGKLVAAAVELRASLVE
jgi:uncharacterized NAD-dependent epimerase/dehydratase family protein